jgi:hypothetical protein
MLFILSAVSNYKNINNYSIIKHMTKSTERDERKEEAGATVDLASSSYKKHLS